MLCLFPNANVCLYITRLSNSTYMNLSIFDMKLKIHIHSTVKASTTAWAESVATRRCPSVVCW